MGSVARRRLNRVEPVLVGKQSGADFLGEPPVLSTEDPREYVSLQGWIAEAVEPKNAIEWIWVADITDIAWQIRRLRNHRRYIVDKKYDDLLWELIDSYRTIRAEKDGIDPYYLSIDDEYMNEEILNIGRKIRHHLSSGGERGLKIVGRFFLRQGKDISMLHTQAFHGSLDEIARLEVLIAELCRRYDSALREVERRRDVIARRLRDIIDAKFEDVKPRRAAGGN